MAAALRERDERIAARERSYDGMAAVLRDAGLAGELTIGDDASTAASLEAMGARHVACPTDEFRVDEEHRIITSPAYMLAGGIAELARGIDRTVDELLRMAG